MLELYDIEQLWENRIFHTTYNVIIDRINMINNISLLRISYLELDYVEQC